MFDVDLAFPLSAGLVAAFNPCGFAMLPAYVSYFLGLESDDETNMAKNVVRGLMVGLTMTLGFIAVFGLVGILTSTIVSESAINSRIPYATVAFGVLMVPLGIAMLRGFEPKLRIPRLQVGGKNSQLPSVFLFGVSYAVVSISCTIGIFLSVVASSFDNGSIADGTAQFVAYGAGMGLVIMILTIGVALARSSVATNMRKILPHVNKISGVMLVLAGVYLTIYGWWEIQVLDSNDPNPFADAVVGRFEDLQSRVTTWVSDVGAGRLALGLTVLIVGILTWALTSTLERRNDRLALRGAFVAIWALIEVLRYDLDLLVLPLLRTIADVPERVGNWFADPLRWPVVFELLAGVIIGTIAWFWARRRFRGAETSVESDTDSSGELQTV
ncbi:MAG: cytochrome c biogenesis CcdA family protein [Actinomycetota bacterium]